MNARSNIDRQQHHQKQFLVRAQKLAEFLASAEAEEVLLSQRLMDAQMTEVFRVIDYGIVTTQIDSQSPELEVICPATQESSSPFQSSTNSLSINPKELQLFDSY